MTDHHLDLRRAAFEERTRAAFRDETTRLVRWLVATAVAGACVSSALLARQVAPPVRELRREREPAWLPLSVVCDRLTSRAGGRSRCGRCGRPAGRRRAAARR